MEAMSQRVNQLSRREKLILLATVIAASYFIFSELLWSPGWQDRNELVNQLETAEILQSSLLDQQAILSGNLNKDPNATLRADNARLTAQLVLKRQQLEETLSRLVAPEDMPDLLIRLLKAIPELQITEVVKLPSVKLQQGEGEGAPVLYSHQIRIVVSGEYFDALRYVQQIESMQGKLRLVALEYSVEDYPRASVILDLETLGLEAGWLGV